jgi:hypothetical protein
MMRTAGHPFPYPSFAEEQLVTSWQATGSTTGSCLREPRVTLRQGEHVKPTVHSWPTHRTGNKTSRRLVNSQ